MEESKHKPGFKKIAGGLKKRPFLAYAVVLALLTLLFLCVKKDNLIQWVGTEISINRLEKEKERLNCEIDSLEERIQFLSSDRDSLEKFARETYVMSEPGDDVYLDN